MMEVISYVPYGCIFKVQTQPGYQIQRVKIKSSCAYYEFDVEDVKQYNQAEFSDDDSKNVYYEAKDLDSETMMLKIKNLKDRRKYEIQLHMNHRKYVVEMIIPEHVFCTHVINVDDVLVLLNPPLGQSNDPLNCHHGLGGYIVKDSFELTTHIADGADVVKMTVKEFEQFSRAYMNRNFPKTKNVLVFPLIRMISDPATREVAEIFRKFLSTRYEFRAIIANLNSNKYIQCCPETDDIVHADLPYYNRLQVFDKRTASILNIRVLNSTNLNGQVHKELEHCGIDLQYFVSSHRHNSCSCFVIGLLAFPNLCRAEIESCLAYYHPKESRHHMKLFYLSHEDLQDVDSLKHWWHNTYQDELKKFDSHISDFEVNALKNICAQSMATVALAEFSKLPTFLDDPLSQLNSLLLNPDQMEVIQSPSNRKIIVGNYGSGKSVVLDEIAKRRFGENLHAKEKVLLLYVIWEEFSLLEIPKKILLDKLKRDEPDRSSHLTLVSGNMQKIWNDLKQVGEVKFLDFLHYFLKESEYKTVHILIDELPTDIVNVSEVREVNKLLKRFPDSSVTIAPQSIIIDRTTFTKDGEINHKRSCLDQLEMDRFELVKAMRNSVQINAIVNASQNKLKCAETLLSVYNPLLANITVVTKLKKKVTSQLKRVFNRVSYTIDSKGTSNETKESAEKHQREHDFSHAGKYPSSASQLQVSVTVPAPKVEQISKIFDNDRVTKKPTSSMKSTYKFHAIENGNGIEDQQPTLIKLPSQVDFESETSANILQEILQEICLRKTAQTMILCNSMKEVRQVSYCLSLIPDFPFVTYVPQLQGMFPSTKEKLDVFSKFSNGSCLLTENDGIKGMEAKRIIMFASQYEYFQMHNFTEIISRGNVWAYVLLHSSDKNDKQETLGGIIQEIENMRLFHVRKVEMSDDTDDDLFDDGIYKIDQFNLMRRQSKHSFDDYQIRFNAKHPVKENQEYYRKFLFTKIAEVEDESKKDEQSHIIIHEITYEGENWSFDDVYNSLHCKDYTTFKKLFQDNRNTLNNLRDKYSYTLLMHASWKGDLHVTKHLLRHFPDVISVCAVDDERKNVYHTAVLCDRVAIIKLLISFDRSELNIRDNDGMSPLHCAAFKGNKRMVQLLLNAGADKDVQNNKGETPDCCTHDDDVKKIIQDHREKGPSLCC